MAKSIIAVQLNSAEAAKLAEAVKADQSARSLAGEVGVMYVKRTSHPVWDSALPIYGHFAAAVEAVVLKAAPNYSNTRMLTKYARDSAQAWFVAEGDATLKAARDAAETAKLEVKSHDAMVAARETQAKREDITVSEQKLAKLALTQAKAERTVAKATAATLAGQYAAAFEAKFPAKVVVMSKEDKLSEFVKAVKTLKAKFEGLEDGSIDRVVGEVTKAYLSRMAHWTEAK